ncbi:MAG: tripartite tricarboxylate transporter substrate binding protein [Hydrogenophaga sp.]|jgi:tripartite-type tricarboxylate transporter receptor subunit TctC|uniref:Bug family tripartite tricarboxylate transporter substrate binding protein n=1 Tax=Hydrogenophaga sp. TaxID=1904254 RepID=UPI00260495C8|nr:tripartite tricarboxylate transporter substrate binding protein [Hydrogenophaga sp.]MCV0441011.1 tripartite tricarboxylate transporter substrate binding protein [Hydrogenophaga sp.]
MTHSFSRRLGVALALASCLFGSAFAQSNPPLLKLIVPFPAGGTADVLPRILAEKLRTHYTAGVVVENRTGAGGNIGAETVFRSAPDGSTFLASPPGPIAINHHLYKKLPFDPTQWVPVTVMATVPNVLAVSTKLPVQSVAEFIAYLKANPGKVTYASQGNGSTSHLTASLFMQLTGTEMTHIPYRGTAPALVDLVGGQVDVFFDNLSSSAQFHTTGKLRILAIADAVRSAALPQVPTFEESKVAGMNAVTFFAVVAPPGTPAATAAALQKQIADAMAMPDVKSRFAEQGAEPRGWSPEQTGRFIQAESDKWNKVIKSANVTLE